MIFVLVGWSFVLGVWVGMKWYDHRLGVRYRADRLSDMEVFDALRAESDRQQAELAQLQADYIGRLVNSGRSFGEG